MKKAAEDQRGCHGGKVAWSVDDNGEMTIRGQFQQKVGESVKGALDGIMSVEEKWEVIKKALCESAQLLLGKTKRRDPDWFLENSHILAPSLVTLLDYRIVYAVPLLGLGVLPGSLTDVLLLIPCVAHCCFIH